MGRSGWFKWDGGKQESQKRERNDEHDLFFYHFSAREVGVIKWVSMVSTLEERHGKLAARQPNGLLLSSLDADLIALLSTFLGGQLIVKSLSKTKVWTEEMAQW